MSPRLHLVAAVVLISILSFAASAAPRTWSANPPTADWASSSNWVGLLIPASGDNVIFPTSTQQSLTNSLAGLNLTGISITAPGYNLGVSGNGVGVSGLVEYTVASNAASTISFPLTQSGALTIRGDDVAFLEIDTLYTDGASVVTLENKVSILTQLDGPSDILVSGTVSTLAKIAGDGTPYSGTITVSSGGSLAIHGDYLLGGSAILAGAGANLYLGDGAKFGLIGPIPGSSGIQAEVHIGDLSASGKQSGRFETTDINFTGGSLIIDINGTNPGSGYDQLFAQNLISLSNVSLNLRKAVGFTPPPGSTYRILDIDNGTFTGLTGTFAGLPDGTTINVGGTEFRILYDFYGVTLEVPETSRRWKGSAGGSQRWSVPGNWEEESAPVSGSDLLFPFDAVSHAPENDLNPGFPIGKIVITGADYELYGNEITLSNGIELGDDFALKGSAVTATTAGPAQIFIPITFDQTQLVNATSLLTFNDELTIDASVTMAGEVKIIGALSGAGSLIALGNDSVVDIQSTSVMSGSIQSQSQALLRFKGTHKGPINVQSNSSAEVTGSVAQLQVSGLLSVGGENSVGTASATAVSFTSTARARFEVNGNTADSLQGTSIILGGATLELVSLTPPSTGSALRIIDNTGAAPVSGTFKNLPQGASISAGGKTMVISYSGGTGNDVVLIDTGGCSVAISALRTVKPNSTGNTASVPNPVSGSTYNWAISNGTITAGQGSAQIVWSAGGNGTVLISVALGGTCSGTANHSATIDLTPASVVLSSTPATIVLTANSGSGGSTGYALTNIGDAATTVTLSRSGAFFTQTPTSFTLAAGASQTVTINVAAQTASGTQRGASLASGQGVPSGLAVPITLLVAAPPATGTPNVIATIDRIDVSASRGESPRGSATFRNIGTAIATGTPSSNVPWIIPDPTGVISIPPGGTVSIGFTIDRAQRPDSSFPTGSVDGALSFVYAATAAGARETSNGPSLAASVPVTDTVKPQPVSGVIPPLVPGELMLMIPGVGNVTGSGGKLFVSDLTLLNKSPLASLPDANLYYIPLSGQTAGAKLDTLGAGGSVNLANIVSTVFNQSQQVGTLMVRSPRVADIVVTASIFNDNNPKGRYGTVIPVLRSDTSVKAGQRLVINGISRDATSHTNLYVQEMAGAVTNATIRFLGAGGAQVGQTLPVVIQPFSLAQLPSVVPDGAVSAVITNDSGGALLSYATPVDDAAGGGDTWAQTDWNKQYSLTGTEPLLVPVAGAAPGANQSYFRTDVSITNSGANTASATLRYTAGATFISKKVELAPLATAVLDDVVAGFLGVTPPSIGSLVITPQGGSFVVTSRTYTSTQGSDATFGTAAPTVALSSGLIVGQSKLLAGIEDSKQTTVSAKTPKSARTNFGLVETRGQPASVKVSLFLNDGRNLAFGAAKGSITIELAANEFRLIPSLTKTVLGDARETQFGDLKNVMVRFDVVGGAGAVVPFVTSTDNGTNDTIFRNE